MSAHGRFEVVAMVPRKRGGLDILERVPFHSGLKLYEALGEAAVASVQKWVYSAYVIGPCCGLHVYREGRRVQVYMRAPSAMERQNFAAVVCDTLRGPSINSQQGRTAHARATTAANVL